MMSDNNTLLHRPQMDVVSYSCVKIYPDGSRKILTATRPIFGGDGWELSNKWDSEKKPKRKATHDAANIMRSKRRAAAKLRDYARCNAFTHFVTLTLNAERIDRYDLDAVLKRMRVWLGNRVRRKGLQYILVPEQHKDGAFHFHGFFNDVLPLTDSGTLIVDGAAKPKRPRSMTERKRWLEACAKTVYNIDDWEFGFSTAIALYGDYNAAISYVSKYITKANVKLGGRWYFSGGDLREPDCELLPMFNYYDFANIDGVYCFEIEGANVGMALLELPDEESFERLCDSIRENHKTD